MTPRPTRFFAPALAAALVLAGGDPALAHPLDAAGAGFAHGFAHPFGGLDHALAMVAVGLWAARLGRPALWLLPLTFVAVMLLGAGLGLAGVAVPSVEAGIAASVLALGALIALDVRPRAASRLALAVAAVGLFALLHGHAHGTELPHAADPARYMAGFALATLALHGAGIGLGVAMATRRERFVRLAGAGIAAAGVVLVLGQV